MRATLSIKSLKVGFDDRFAPFLHSKMLGGFPYISNTIYRVLSHIHQRTHDFHKNKSLSAFLKIARYTRESHLKWIRDINTEKGQICGRTLQYKEQIGT